MTTVSPLSSSLLQALANNGNASSGATESSLLAALGNAQDTSATTSNELLQTLVTLTSANASSSDGSSQTYNAQGLLNRIQAAMPENPLFATDTSGGTANDNGTLLGSILDSTQAGNGTSASGSSSSANLLQLFQQSPTLASAYVDGEVTQSLFSDMA